MNHLHKIAKFQFSPSREGGRPYGAMGRNSKTFQFSPSREGGLVGGNFFQRLFDFNSRPRVRAVLPIESLIEAANISILALA